MKKLNSRKQTGRPPKMTLRSAPRTFKPCDEVEEVLVRESDKQAKTFTLLIEESIAAHLGKNSKKIRSGRFSYLFT